VGHTRRAVDCVGKADRYKKLLLRPREGMHVVCACVWLLLAWRCCHMRVYNIMCLRVRVRVHVRDMMYVAQCRTRCDSNASGIAKLAQPHPPVPHHQTQTVTKTVNSMAGTKGLLVRVVDFAVVGQPRARSFPDLLNHIRTFRKCVLMIPPRRVPSVTCMFFQCTL